MDLDDLLEESLKRDSPQKRAQSANPFGKKKDNDSFTAFDEFDWNDSKPAAKKPSKLSSNLWPKAEKSVDNQWGALNSTGGSKNKKD